MPNWESRISDLMSDTPLGKEMRDGMLEVFRGNRDLALAVNEKRGKPSGNFQISENDIADVIKVVGENKDLRERFFSGRSSVISQLKAATRDENQQFVTKARYRLMAACILAENQGIYEASLLAIKLKGKDVAVSAAARDQLPAQAPRWKEPSKTTESKLWQVEELRKLLKHDPYAIRSCIAVLLNDGINVDLIDKSKINETFLTKTLADKKVAGILRGYIPAYENWAKLEDPEVAIGNLRMLAAATLICGAGSDSVFSDQKLKDRYISAIQELAKAQEKLTTTPQASSKKTPPPIKPRVKKTSPAAIDGAFLILMHVNNSDPNKEELPEELCKLLEENDEVKRVVAEYLSQSHLFPAVKKLLRDDKKTSVKPSEINVDFLSKVFPNPGTYALRKERELLSSAVAVAGDMLFGKSYKFDRLEELRAKDDRQILFGLAYILSSGEARVLVENLTGIKRPITQEDITADFLRKILNPKKELEEDKKRLMAILAKYIKSYKKDVEEREDNTDFLRGLMVVCLVYDGAEYDDKVIYEASARWLENKELMKGLDAATKFQFQGSSNPIVIASSIDSADSKPASKEYILPQWRSAAIEKLTEGSPVKVAIADILSRNKEVLAAVRRLWKSVEEGEGGYETTSVDSSEVTEPFIRSILMPREEGKLAHDRDLVMRFVGEAMAKAIKDKNADYLMATCLIHDGRGKSITMYEKDGGKKEQGKFIGDDCCREVYSNALKAKFELRSPSGEVRRPINAVPFAATQQYYR